MLSGTFSQLLEVLTGVPQGSVLGPLLFLLFVNELPSWIISDMKMFADDAKVWCRIKTETDRITLQELDLDHLQLWSNIWRLRFNADKCKVMHIGYSCGTRHYVYGRGAYKEGTGISTRGEGPGCNHHNRSEVIQSVHQINGNSKDGDRNGQKKFQTSGYRWLQTHLQDLHPATPRVLHSSLVSIFRQRHWNIGKSPGRSNKSSTTVEEVQLSSQTEEDRHHVSERQKAQRRYDWSIQITDGEITDRPRLQTVLQISWESLWSQRTR